MTSCPSRERAFRPLAILSPLAWKVFAVSSCLFLPLGCSSEPVEVTPTPLPVLIGERVKVEASVTGVAVSGEPGAVTSSARVDVANASTGQTVTTTAAADGTFELELGGTLMDAYQMYATLGEQSSRAVSIFGFTSDGEPGLAGLEFSSVSADGFTPATNTAILLSFDTYSELSFGAGCNTHSASYGACDGRLCISELSATEIGCEPILQSQDRWLAAFFGSSPRLTRQGPRLRLASADASLEFIERDLLDPDRPLTGRTWTIDTIIDGERGRSVGLEPTISFETNITLQVFTTCTSGSGLYAAVDRELTIYDMEYLEKPCDASGDANIDEPIRRVLRDGTVRFEVDTARLTLTRGSDGLQAGTD